MSETINIPDSPKADAIPDLPKADFIPDLPKVDMIPGLPKVDIFAKQVLGKKVLADTDTLWQ
ncbi:MAG: hypothetical protein ACOYIG_09040, partial [Acetivibrionales bacterium]